MNSGSGTRLTYGSLYAFLGQVRKWTFRVFALALGMGFLGIVIAHGIPSDVGQVVAGFLTLAFFGLTFCGMASVVFCAIGVVALNQYIHWRDSR